MPAPVKLAAGHPMCRPLFSPLDAFCRNALAQLPKALDAVMPLSRNHRADLPEAIRDLSAMLTYERGGLGRSYWSAPRYVSAYLRYFCRGILCGCPASCRVWICPSPFATPKRR